ncbi:hypothetical protein MMC08_003673, partial [Hypocenomyce scalaris]|nr:hypothetical protein [Hypocenomyce scalaris]
MQSGGMTKLEPYVKESLLLGDKYLALGRFAPPTLPLDWGPGPMPEKRMLKIQSEIGSMLLYLAQGLLELEENPLCPEMLSITNDMVD